MFKFTQEQKIHYTLRIAAAMCFIGHGAFGIITKPVWANYFAVFGINHDLSFKLMPLLGTVDILLGIIILIYPLRAVIIWLVIWGIITALLRPLSGEPFAEFIERAGNFGAPLVLIILSGGFSKNIKQVLTPVEDNIHADGKTLGLIKTCLSIVIFFLFVGHGWLNIIGKKGLVDQYSALGFVSAANVARGIGAFEIIAALVILIHPVKSIVMALFIWKITSELFYPHYELFEWIERGGSYGCLLALYIISDTAKAIKKNNGFTNKGFHINLSHGPAGYGWWRQRSQRAAPVHIR
ncbi:MAG: hypothetical protein ABI863_10740 [Ginsengibacter sp.]